MDEDEYQDDPCPLCEGPLGLLGQLGIIAHFVCRNCGGHVSREVAAHEED
jgi:hypothetical protein